MSWSCKDASIQFFFLEKYPQQCIPGSHAGCLQFAFFFFFEKDVIFNVDDAAYIENAHLLILSGLFPNFISPINHSSFDTILVSENFRMPFKQIKHFVQALLKCFLTLKVGP